LTRRVLAALLALCAALPALAAPDLSADALLRDHLWREVRRAPPERRPKVGLVLSAGSLRGTAHVGVIKVLEETGFPIDVVAGTSMGSVVGAMYAGGLNPRTLVSFLLFNQLLSSEKTELMVRKNLGGLRFDQLKKPFACVAMDVYTGEAITFREGDVALAVRASMYLPGIFAPLEYRHRYLVDGGVVDYIPVDAARQLGAEWTIASVTENDYTAARPKNVLDSLEQVIDIRGSFLSREQRKKVDFLIEPQVGDIGMFEDFRIPEAMEKGVVTASKKVVDAQESLILAALPRLSAPWLSPAGPGGAR
jgi:NTE family protein